MIESQPPRWTLKSENGESPPPEILAIVEIWLAESDGDLAQALVMAARERAILENAASFGLCRGAVWRADTGKGAG